MPMRLTAYPLKRDFQDERTPMKRIFQPLLTCLLGTVFSLTLLSKAHAQFTYTYFPNDTTINGPVTTTDLAIVGYSGGSYDDNFNPAFNGPSSPTIQVVSGANSTLR